MEIPRGVTSEHQHFQGGQSITYGIPGSVHISHRFHGIMCKNPWKFQGVVKVIPVFPRHGTVGTGNPGGLSYFDMSSIGGGCG